MNYFMIFTFFMLGGLLVYAIIFAVRKEKVEFAQIGDALLGKEDLEKHAIVLARNHTAAKVRRSYRWLLARMNSNQRYISNVYTAVNEDIRNGFPTAPASEWLLDNFYIIEDQVDDIRKTLSRDIHAKLPVLKAGFYRGYPRIYALVLEIIGHTDGVVDERIMTDFIKAYQSESLLTIGELWSLSIMLRIALIENIRQICGNILLSRNQWHKAEEIAHVLAEGENTGEDRLAELIPAEFDDTVNISAPLVEHLLHTLKKQGGRMPDITHFLDLKLEDANSSTGKLTELEHKLQAARQVSIGNSITSLRTVSALNWSELFEVLSHVDSILRQDPAGIYPRMDFESRDYYRFTVEKLARHYKISETQVARKTIECAEEAKEKKLQEDAPKHIGYYLIDSGRDELERRVNTKSGSSWSFSRALARHPRWVYMGSIIFITLVLTAFFAVYSYRTAAFLPGLAAFITLLAVVIPVSGIVMALVNNVISHIYRPAILPKMELKDGIPYDLCTMVIVPTLLPNEKRVRELVDQLEVTYLANRDNNLYFALLGDFRDSAEKDMETDSSIVKAALEGIRRLNDLYAEKDGERFFYLHRHRQFNLRQNKWMGWERKRGAIVEFNAILRGNNDTSYTISSSELHKLPKIKYVITLDADTSLPLGMARKLVGTMAHPLNHAVVDEKKGIVARGYGLLQPRIGLNITSANKTPFSRIFAGQGGIDPYTTAVSDVYQDLFGEGIFTGKGIYELDVFNRILENAIPDNVVLSHDLLEGSYIQTGLATDLEMIDGYPARYNAFSMRLHRWVRGDWQLLPWLGSRVRNRRGIKVKNPLSFVSKWKIADNLRRSLTDPALLILTFLSFSILPGNRFVWLGLIFITACIPVISYIVNYILSGRYDFHRQRRYSTVIDGLRAALYQSALLLIFVPYQAFLMLHAIIKTLGRVFFTHKNMLEWVTAADVEANLKNDLRSFWRRMWVCPVSGALVVILAAVFSPSMLAASAVFLVLWAPAPYIAYRISKPYEKAGSKLAVHDLRELRKLARKTWAYFEDFAGETDHYLPPDNYQEEPVRAVAHRTSPTNIGFLLLSIISARDFGYIGTMEMADRLDQTIRTVEKLEKWKGHLYNWYDTITLETLRPLYVSTVDSGNFLGYLMVVKQALQEYLRKPLLDINLAYGLQDIINLANEENPDLALRIESLESYIEEEKLNLERWDEILKELEQRLQESCTQSCMLKGFWSLKLRETAEKLKNEYKRLALFTGSMKQSAGSMEKDTSDIPSLLDLAGDYGTLPQIDAAGEEIRHCETLIRDLMQRVGQLVDGMEFKHLFDYKRQLFSIGFNVEEGHLTKSYYDLLASEARQASYIAVARGEVDVKHWFRLGRKLVLIEKYKGLVSWTGTMFEYLMPFLLMRDYENTLLDETYRFVVENQKRYGAQRNIPWGVSESGYSAYDINLNYQYRAFGIPELGLKRGLENDIVIAPYATFLALALDPQSAMNNIWRLKEEGIYGTYGLYEAVDYTPSRLVKNSSRNIVKSFMAHHLGMSFIALDNYIYSNIMQTRFHTSPVIRSAELLLQEKIPSRFTYSKNVSRALMPLRKMDRDEGEVVRILGIPSSPLPDVHILSNGNYSVMLTNGGNGYSRHRDTAVTRWNGDIRGKNPGVFIFIQNMNSNNIWSSTFEPLKVKPEKYKVIFSPDKAEFTRRDGNIETRTEITVSPEDQAEIRRVSISNFSRKVREIELTSYLEVILTTVEADMAHPAFSNLFIKTEYIPEYGSLIASRRPRSGKQQPVWAVHTIAVEGQAIGETQYETDRAKFIGRNRDLSNPLALDMNQPLSNSEGAVLDPILSLRRRVRIEPGNTVRVSFIVAAAETRRKALELADKYRDPRAGGRAFELAWTRSQIESRYLGLKPQDVETYWSMVPAIFFPNLLRRSREDIIMQNKKGQQDLWPFGVSGDVPVVLLSVGSRDEMDMVYWILKAHEFWRVKAIIVDLVILIENESSYTQPLQDVIHDAVSASHAREMIDSRGGVFIRNAAHMPVESRNLFYTVARIVLKGSGGPAKKQLAAEMDERSLYPLVHRSYHNIKGEKPFLTQKMPAACRIESPRELKFFNGIGGFSQDGREYILSLDENTHTPAPWINVISNPGFGFLATESGSGYTWAENSRENKLTPWSNDPVTDPPGEVLYIRDDAEGESWSITPMPVREAGTYQVRHGFGYSVYNHNSHGIDQELTQFVALEHPVKICLVSLRNESAESRKLNLVYYIRPVLGVSEHMTSPYITTRLLGNSEALAVENKYSTDYTGRVVFVSGSENINSFTGDQLEFIGVNGSLKDPEGLKREKFSGRLGAGYDPCAAIQVKIELPPDGEKNVVFLLGQAESDSRALEYINKFRLTDEAVNELERVKKFWRVKTGMVRVSTPDLSMDILLNGWLLYQVLSCRIWSRSAFYQSGGAYGFRDQLQDVMAVVYAMPELTRRQIILHSMHQFIEGDVQHWWHEEAGKGIRTRYSDDLVWLAYVTADYVKITGDWDVLDEETIYLQSPLLKEGEDERYEVPSVSGEKSSIYEHCTRAIDKSLKYGEHGIPLMGCGDWNDGMNSVGNGGKGESVWLGWFIYTTLQKFIPLCEKRGDYEKAQQYKDAAAKIATSVEENGWDGSWYLRAYFDDGTPLGSSRNSECSIDSIAQSWSIISGVGSGPRAEEAMNAVDKYLVDDERGIIKLLTPPFDRGDLNPGYIKGYVPGVRENGGQYTHAATWVILAFARMGMGDRAWRLFNLINPINHTRTSIEYSKYKLEPYVMAADVYAVPPHTGRGGWSWYTGAAGWMYRVGLEHILGIRKDGSRLTLEPCIPEEWDGYNVRYEFGSSIYHINISNPQRVSRGVQSIRTDGKILKEGFITLIDDGQEHHIEVLMG